MENTLHILTEEQIWVRSHELFYTYFADAKSAMGISDIEYDTIPAYALMVDNNIWLTITTLENGQENG